MRHAPTIAVLLGAAALAGCEESEPTPVAAPAAAVAPGGPLPSPVMGQTVTVQPDGTVSRETFTHGAPTGGAFPPAEPPQSVPAVPPTQVVLPASCGLGPLGGSGYACER